MVPGGPQLNGRWGDKEIGAGTDGPEVFRHQAQPVALFHPQLAYLPEDGGTLGPGGEHGQERDLVDQARNLARADLGGPKTRRLHHEIAHRLSEVGGAVLNPDPPPHSADHVQETGSGRVHSDAGDPELAGIGQTQVNPRIDLTFAKSLRAILRQDPDVIMIGEIRDLETAQIAIQASLTGHLVLSTLHTNDAASTPMRLVEMGVEPYLVASALTLVASQQLVLRAASEK